MAIGGVFVEQVTEVTEVTVKGWRNGLLLALPLETPWAEVIEQTHAKLDEAKARSFWRGAQTTLDCGDRSVSGEELTALMDRIKRGFGLVPVAIVATDAATREAGEKLALKSYEELPIIQKPRERDRDKSNSDKEAAEASANGSGASHSGPNAGTDIAVRGNFAAHNALYVPGTVRSGQRIVHDTHLIIVGDVNAGAEVAAGGDIIVFGDAARTWLTRDASGRRQPALSLETCARRNSASPGKSPVPAEETERGSGAVRVPEVARIEGGEIGVFSVIMYA